MASHAPQTIHFVTNEGSVMSSGGSLRLKKGQLGVVDRGATPTSAGLPVVSSLPTTPKDRMFELRLGISDLSVTRSQSNKAYSSRPFKLSEVVDIRVTAPKIGGTNDELIIGYDGINANTAIQLTNGDNEVIDITLSGEAIGMLGYHDSKVTVKLYLEAPNGDAPFTNHEIIEKGVERLKKVTLMGGVPITEYIDIVPVNSENPATVTGESQVFQSLIVPDAGNSAALAKVQTQYPLYDIKRESYSGSASKYVVITDEDATLSDFEVVITSLDGDCGEPECTELVTNTYEWVEGETCTAIGREYKIQLKDDDCNGGTLAALQAAYPELTITVDDASGNLQQIVTLSGESGDASISVNGVTYTTAYVTSPTATATAFATAHAAAILTASGAVVTASGAGVIFRASALNFPTIATVAGGMTETVGAITDDSTSTNVAGGCQTVYRTTVYSDLVCEDCSPVFRDLFVAEAPQPYKFTDWVLTVPAYDADALMGIKLTGKTAIFAGSEEYRDNIPFVYSPVRISVANEAPGQVNQSYKVGTNGRFAVKLLSIASVPESLGMNFYDQEERTRVYFENRQRLHGNNYGKLVLGQETLLKPTTQYVDYAIRIEASRYSQSFSSKNADNIEYHILVDACNHQDVETLVNAIATAAGLPTVTAYLP